MWGGGGGGVEGVEGAEGVEGWKVWRDGGSGGGRCGVHIQFGCMHSFKMHTDSILHYNRQLSDSEHSDL